MNFAGLQKLLGQRVNVWPRPYWAQARRRTPMQWLVNRVDQTTGAVDLLAPSGHIKNLADVINHYERAGNTLVLDAQLIIDGGKVVVEPRPWGATSRSFRRRRRHRRQTGIHPSAPVPAPVLKEMLALVGCLAIIKAIADS